MLTGSRCTNFEHSNRFPHRQVLSRTHISFITLHVLSHLLTFLSLVLGSGPAAALPRGCSFRPADDKLASACATTCLVVADRSRMASSQLFSLISAHGAVLLRTPPPRQRVIIQHRAGYGLARHAAGAVHCGSYSGGSETSGGTSDCATACQARTRRPSQLDSQRLVYARKFLFRDCHLRCDGSPSCPQPGSAHQLHGMHRPQVHGCL